VVIGNIAGMRLMFISNNNKIADWWIDQMYHPNSNHVLKIKQHFENIVADRNNAVNNLINVYLLCFTWCWEW